MSYLTVVPLILTAFVALHCVDGQARTCYFGPPPQPDPNNPDWMKQAMKEIWKNCPGRRRNPYTDPCSFNPCLNGGTCRLDRNSLTCECPKEFNGSRCEVILAKDCSEVLAKNVTTSGVYTVYPRDDGEPITVYCDMETDGGGWTVFQKRQDGSVDFYLDWESYRQGFGDLDGEFWLGNDNLHRLTAQGDYKLRVDLEDFDGNSVYAVYDNFSVADGSDNYRLRVGGFSGTAGDSLEKHNNQPFTTKDRDNDGFGSNCAQDYHGAWW